MHKAAFCGALALVSLGGCATAPDGNPTIGGVEVNLGSSLNAKLIKVGQKIDAGLPVVQTDVAALCQLAAKAEPVAAASPAILNQSGAAVAAKIAAGLEAWASSPTCANPVTGTVADAVNLTKTIAQIKSASGGVLTATSVAAQ